MNRNHLIAQKLREIADLLEQTEPTAEPTAEPPAKRAKKSQVPTDPKNQIALELAVIAPEPATPEPTIEPTLAAEPTIEPTLAAELVIEPVAIPAAPVVTINDVRQCAAKLIGRGDREKVIEILTLFGVQKISDLADNQFFAILEKFNAAR